MPGELIVLLFLIVVGILVWRRVRRRSRKPPKAQPGLAPIEVGGNLPTFNIIALGGQETGKTVLLASMFHRLSTEISDGGFRLQTGLDQAVFLTNLYLKLSDPGAEWPAAFGPQT